MAFDFNQDLQTMMDMFGNCDVAISLYGAPVASIRGIFDLSSDVVSPFESDHLVIRPVVAVLDTGFAGVTSDHVLTITKDGASTGKDYKFYGKPRPDGAGLTVVHLAEKL